jgi:hypothetical protein
MEGKTTLLPGETCRHADSIGNPYRKVRLNRQESAEAVVPERRRPIREGPNMIVRVVHGEFERSKESRKSRKGAIFRRKQ